jgi:hypothetical protein
VTSVNSGGDYAAPLISCAVSVKVVVTNVNTSRQQVEQADVTVQEFLPVGTPAATVELMHMFQVDDKNQYSHEHYGCLVFGAKAPVDQVQPPHELCSLCHRVLWNGKPCVSQVFSSSRVIIMSSELAVIFAAVILGLSFNNQSLFSFPLICCRIFVAAIKRVDPDHRRVTVITTLSSPVSFLSWPLVSLVEGAR